MACIIQIRRGLESNIPTLSAGELGFTTDTYKTYIGDGTNNHILGGILWVNKTSAYTISSNEGVFADTSGGAFSLTMPSNPSIGDTIIIDDVSSSFDTNALTINRNGKKINNNTEDVVLTTKSVRVECIFSGDSIGWRIVSYDGSVVEAATSETTHITTADDTPDVQDISLIIIDYDSPLSISNFDNAVEGQEVSVLFKTDQTTILNNTNIDFSDDQNYQGEINDVITFIYDGSKWIESSRVPAAYSSTDVDGTTSHVDTADTTPSVDNNTTLLIIDYNSPLTITNFDDGVEGQELSVLFKTDQSTLSDNANIEMVDDQDYQGEINDIITFIYDGTKWIESSRIPTSYKDSAETIHLNSADTTPSVDEKSTLLIIDYDSPLTITNFDDGIEGNELTILFKTDQVTIEDNANIILSDDMDFTGEVNNVITFIYDGTKWIESSRDTSTF